MILKLYSEHLSTDGKVTLTRPRIHAAWRLFRGFPLLGLSSASFLLQSVDYKGMSVDPVFERYSELAIQLQRLELFSLTREEKLAFFINIYNALVIHGLLKMGAPTNMFQRYRVWPRHHSCSQNINSCI